MKKLYIHIGTHKTGTTSLQKLCYKYIKELGDEDIHIIKHKDVPYKAEFNSGSVSREELTSTLRSFLREELSSQHNKHFLCWEGFSGNLLSLYRNRVKTLDVLKEAIPDNIELSLIVVFRRQDDFVQSAYSQTIHQGEFETSAEDLLNTEYNEGIDWLVFVNQLKELFPEANLNALPYYKNLLIEKPLHKLVGEIVGSEFLMNHSDQSKANVGMTTEAAKLFESLNNRGISNKASEKLLRRILQQTSNKGTFNEYTYLNYDKKLELLENYQESNKKLAELYWKDKFGINNFPEPVDVTQQNDNEGNVEEQVIRELLNVIIEQREKLRSSFVMKVANKVNKLTG